jgi:xylose isomerase
MGFLNQYGLSDEFKLNIECNHATLAGHSCDHELQVCTLHQAQQPPVDR